MARLNPPHVKISILFVVLAFCAGKFSHAQITKLFDFTRTIDIQFPASDHLVSDGTWLYATSARGGANNGGALFRIKHDGTGFSKLMDFSSPFSEAAPAAPLTILGNVLYGINSLDGTNSAGILYSINTDGTDYTKIVDFEPSTKGSSPRGAVLISNNILYGMTLLGGTNNLGCIFKVNTDGTGFVKLKDFSGTGDGAHPLGSLTIDGNILYGMTSEGGANNRGSIFSININGTGFNKLFDFNGTISGSTPHGSLIVSNNELFGMTSEGGVNNKGCIFKIKTDGTGYTNLLDFDNDTNGANPYGSLIISDNILFGTTYSADNNSNTGTIFRINTDGTGYQKLSDVNLAGHSSGSLLLLENILYGMTDIGGAEQMGSIFKINTDGTMFANLLHFGLPGNGSNPQGITISDNVSYGITTSGGAYGAGCIFKINIDGTGYVKLFDFNGVPNGASPTGSLVLSGSVLFGTTSGGGTNNIGSVFKVNIDGTGYTTIHSFNESENGYTPFGTPALSGKVLYGTTFSGGNFGLGTIYKINTDGTGYAKLLSFDQVNGANPTDGLLVSGEILYGATPFGGTGVGNIFKINTDGTGFVNLYNFSSTADGSYFPYTKPVLIENTLYGTTGELAATHQGTIYKINTDGTGFVTLKNFIAEDGLHPSGSMIAVGNTLYGTTSNGGSANTGTLYKFNTVNNIFTKLWDLTSQNGREPSGSLAYASGILYGVTHYGGISDKGVIFSFTMPSNLKIDPVITWNNPADITYGTLLGTNQLNAIADVPGTSIYTPPAGTKLEIGMGQSLKVDFTPADAASYNTIGKTVTINVTQATGVEDPVQNTGIKIYPNPFSDYITVESVKSYSSVSVWDLNGKLITEVATNGRLKNTVSLKKLVSGTYLVGLKDSANEILTVKRLEKVE